VSLHLPPVAGPLSALDVPFFDANWYLDVTDFARHTVWMNAAVDAWSTYGVLVFALLLVAAWWSGRRTSSRATAAALCAPITTVLAVVLTLAIKSMVAEPRPCYAFPHAFTVAPCPVLSDYSFPSNHATIAGAVAMGVILVNRRLGSLATAAALLMAASRVYIGVHYPHDVVVGLAVGATVSLAGYVIVRRPLTGLVDTLGRTRLRPLLMSADQHRVGVVEHLVDSGGMSNDHVARRARG
jgi:undecaprenyl-diphosphatase